MRWNPKATQTQHLKPTYHICTSNEVFGEHTRKAPRFRGSCDSERAPLWEANNDEEEHEREVPLSILIA